MTFLFNPFILANHRPWNIEEIFRGGKDKYNFIFWSTHKYMSVFSQSLFIHPHWKITLFLHSLELWINPRDLWKSGSILMILWYYKRRIGVVRLYTWLFIQPVYFGKSKRRKYWENSPGEKGRYIFTFWSTRKYMTVFLKVFPSILIGKLLFFFILGSSR